MLAAITGVATGFAVALFDRIVVDGILDHLFELSPWVLAFMPLVGLALSWLALFHVGPFTRRGHDRPLPQGVPRSRAVVPPPRVPRSDAGGDRDARVRGRDGPRGRIALPGLVLRVVPPAALPALHRREQSARAAGGGRGRRRRRHLQGTGHRRDLRPRGAVPGGSRPAHAAARAGRVGVGLPRVRRRQRHHTTVRGAAAHRRCRSPTSPARSGSASPPGSAHAGSHGS